MSVDTDTVKRVARLARIKVSEEDATRMTGEVNAILGFVEQLDEVDISGVEPLTSVVEQTMIVERLAFERDKRRALLIIARERRLLILEAARLAD